MKKGLNRTLLLYFSNVKLDVNNLLTYNKLHYVGLFNSFENFKEHLKLLEIELYLQYSIS